MDDKVGQPPTHHETMGKHKSSMPTFRSLKSLTFSKEHTPSEASTQPSHNDEIESDDDIGTAGWISLHRNHDEKSPWLEILLNRMVITPDNIGRQIWTAVVGVLLVYTGTVFPYRLCFLEFRIPVESEDNASFETLEAIVDVLFWIDLAAGFFFSYTNATGKEVVVWRAIVFKYMKGYLALNFIACLPPAAVGAITYLFIGASSDTEHSDASMTRTLRLLRIQRVTRLARLTRLTRLMKFLSFCKTNPILRNVESMRGVRIVNFTAGLFWIVHLVACGWYLVASVADENPEESWVGRRTLQDGSSLLERGHVDQWIQSMYFVLTVFTTVGFGDMYALTTPEIFYVSFMMLLGAVVHSIIVSEMINVVTSADQKSIELEKQRKRLTQFCKDAELRPTLVDGMTDRLDRTGAISERNPEQVCELIIGCASRRALANIPQQLFRGALLSSKFVTCLSVVGARQLPPRLPLLLAAYVTKRKFDDGEMVYCFGDLPVNVYLVVQGVFAAIGRPDRKLGGSCDVEIDQVRVPIALGKNMPKPMNGLQHLRSFSTSIDPKAAAAGILKAGSPMNLFNTNSPKLEKNLDPEPEAERQLRPYALYCYENHFGDYEVMCHAHGGTSGARNTSVRCEAAGTCLMIPRQVLKKMADDFPGFCKIWKQQAIRREWHRQAQLETLTQDWDYKALAVLFIQKMVRIKLFGKEAWKGKRKGRGKAQGIRALTANAHRLGNDAQAPGKAHHGSDHHGHDDQNQRSESHHHHHHQASDAMKSLQNDVNALQTQVQTQSQQLNHLQSSFEAFRTDLSTALGLVPTQVLQAAPKHHL